MRQMNKNYPMRVIFPALFDVDCSLTIICLAEFCTQYIIRQVPNVSNIAISFAGKKRVFFNIYIWLMLVNIKEDTG